jgi:putative addiction module CopG family antidote
MKVTIPEEMRDWVKLQVETGRYASVTDYVCALIRRDQAQADTRAALVAALIDREGGGVSARRIPNVLVSRHGLR